MQRFRINEIKIYEKQRSFKFAMFVFLIAIVSLIFESGKLNGISMILFPIILILLPYNLRELLFIKSIEKYRNILPADTAVNISDLSEIMRLSEIKIIKQLKVLISRGYIEGVFSDDDTIVTLYSWQKFINNFNAAKFQSDTDSRFIECSKCAVKNQLDFKFCYECGEKLS